MKSKENTGAELDYNKFGDIFFKKTLKNYLLDCTLAPPPPPPPGSPSKTAGEFQLSLSEISGSSTPVIHVISNIVKIDKATVKSVSTDDSVLKLLKPDK